MDGFFGLYIWRGVKLLRRGRIGFCEIPGECRLVYSNGWARTAQLDNHHHHHHPDP